MTLYFTGTQQQVTDANAQIGLNAGLPFRNTETWDVPQSSYSDPTLWFILMPPASGWTREDGTHFTQEQMIAAVVNVEIQEGQSNWFPPFPPVGAK